MRKLEFNPPPDFIPSPNKPANQITDVDVEALFPDAGKRRKFAHDYRLMVLRLSLTHPQAHLTPQPAHRVAEANNG